MTKQLTMKKILLLSSFLILITALLFSFKTDKKLIIIDAGHGGDDHGAIVNNILEKDLVLDIANLIQASSKNKDFEIVLTRDGDFTLPLAKRVSMITSKKPVLLLSLHMNNFPSTSKSTNGTEIFTQANDVSRDLGIQLSRHFDDCATAEKNLYILKNSEVPAIILELGNMRNEKDLKYVESAHGKREISHKITKFIADL